MESKSTSGFQGQLETEANRKADLRMSLPPLTLEDAAINYGLCFVIILIPVNHVDTMSDLADLDGLNTQILSDNVLFIIFLPVVFQ